MSRTEHQLAVAALALAGCMRIYPDPELPDLEVTWSSRSDCGADEQVAVSLAAGDPRTERYAATAACADGSVTIADVERERYVATVRLEHPANGVQATYEEDVDFRAGINERIIAFFLRGFDTTFTVTWTFPSPATCTSLGATVVDLAFASTTGAPAFSARLPCGLGEFTQTTSDHGDYTVEARALAGDRVVAAAPASPPFHLIAGEHTTIEPLVLTPCGDDCPASVLPE